MRILMVEDNPADARLAVEALKEAKVGNDLAVAEDGLEAMMMLRASLEAGRLPDLILLDLNLPRMGGREVLTEIKLDPELKHIPVVVLTTSQAEQDIRHSYEMHAAGYVQKPVDFDQFLDTVRAIEGFWLTVVTYAA